MKAHRIYAIMLILLGLTPCALFSQNNVGIGTRDPHVTAILDVKDTARGFLLPQTDTQSVQNYVNTLVPYPGIAHGTTIWENNMRTIYVYNGLKQKWEPVSSLRGPRGVTGVTGRTGVRGDRGIATQWRDSALLPPFKRKPHPNVKPPYYETLGDTCGDFYHQTSTGLIWTYDCVQHIWTGPIARWRNFGVPTMEKIQAPGLLEESMPTSPAGNNLKLLGNLTYTILVPPDTVAYIWATTEGQVQKKYVDYKEVNKVAFDFYLTDTTGAKSYMGRRRTVTIGPNIKIPLTSTSQFDKVEWEISTSLTVEGKISPAGSPLPINDYRSVTLETHYGQLFQTGNTIHTDSSKVIILDNAGSVSNQQENFAVMSIFVIFERSRNAAYPY